MSFRGPNPLNDMQKNRGILHPLISSAFGNCDEGAEHSGTIHLAV